MSNTSKYRQFYYNYIDYKYGYTNYDKISYKINDLYINIKKNILQFPILNDNNQLILDGSNFTNLPFIEFLFNYDTTLNRYKGFNQVKINEIVKSPLNLYSNIKNEHLQYFIRLKNAYSNLNSNLYYVKQFQEFFSQFKFIDTNFYTYGLNTSSNYIVDNISNNYDFSILTYIICEEFLLSIKQKVFDNINYKLKLNIYSGSSSTVQNIKDYFNIYIVTNNDLISTELSKYILVSILGLENYSDDYLVKIKSKISELIKDIPALFSSFIGTQITDTFQLALISSINDCIYDEFMRKYVIINSSLFELPNKYDFSEDYLIFQNILTFIMKNYEQDITSLEYITYQFIKSPVQFINSHSYIYNEFLQNNLETDEIKTTFDFLNDERIISVLNNLKINTSRLANINKDRYLVGELTKSATYYARVKRQRLNLSWSEWSEPLVFSTIPFIIETTPTFNSVNVSLTPLLTLTAFNISNLYNHKNTQWQVASDLEFNNIVEDSGQIENVINKTTYRVKNLLNINITYHTRIRYEDVTGAWSSWSAVISFLTISYIDIQYPYNNSQNVSVHPTLKIENFNISVEDGDIDSKWQIARDVNFNDIVRDSDVPGCILPTIGEILNNKSIIQGCNNIYLSWIYKFIDSQKFEKYLFQFMLEIKPEISSRFNINDDTLFEQIYSFRQFFKLLFSKVIYDGHLFQNETDKMISEYTSLNSLFSLSIDDLDKLANNFKDSDYVTKMNIQEKMSNFYIETIISNIVYYIIDSYSI